MEEDPERTPTEEEEIILEKQDEMQNLGIDGYGYPTPPAKDSIFKFFREILDRKDSSKVGNLTNSEIGIPPVTVRGWQSIGLYAEMEGLDKVAEYLRSEAEIVLATSSSRKGFLPQLFVTQIKKEQKVKSGVEMQKKGWFSKESKQGEEQ